MNPLAALGIASVFSCTSTVTTVKMFWQWSFFAIEETAMDVSKGWDWKPVKRAECGRRMKILTLGTLGVSVPQTPEIQIMVMKGEAKGTFCCPTCGRFCCYDCSDMDKTCVCGKSGLWKQGVYKEG
jgi:hypothetical protein